MIAFITAAAAWDERCSCRKPPPRSSCRMLILVDHSPELVASSYVKAVGQGLRALPQWLERAGVLDALMRPVPVVELLELLQGVQKVGLVPDQRAIQQPGPARAPRHR